MPELKVFEITDEEKIENIFDLLKNNPCIMRCHHTDCQRFHLDESLNFPAFVDYSKIEKEFNYMSWKNESIENFIAEVEMFDASSIVLSDTTNHKIIKSFWKIYKWV